MSKCKICKYRKECPDAVEENSIYCTIHRRIPKDFNNDYIEKEQLISFLEDKIKETDKLRKMHEMYSLSEERLSSKYYTFCEVLDFVKGDKDE